MRLADTASADLSGAPAAGQQDGYREANEAERAALAFLPHPDVHGRALSMRPGSSRARGPTMLFLALLALRPGSRAAEHCRTRSYMSTVGCGIVLVPTRV